MVLGDQHDATVNCLARMATDGVLLPLQQSDQPELLQSSLHWHLAAAVQANGDVYNWHKCTPQLLNPQSSVPGYQPRHSY